MDRRITVEVQFAEIMGESFGRSARENQEDDSRGVCNAIRRWLSTRLVPEFNLRNFEDMLRGELHKLG